MIELNAPIFIFAILLFNFKIFVAVSLSLLAEPSL